MHQPLRRQIQGHTYRHKKINSGNAVFNINIAIVISILRFSTKYTPNIKICTLPFSQDSLSSCGENCAQQLRHSWAPMRV